jgi:hypothetical protein
MANPSTIDATPSSLDPTSSRDPSSSRRLTHTKSGVITLRHLKAFHFSETKKPLLFPFCSEITTWTARLEWQRLCDVSESNGDEDDISTGHCRGIDRFNHRVRFVLAIHSVRRNWRHGYSCIHRQERVSSDEHGVRTKPDRHRRRRDNHVDQQRFRGAHISG